MLFKKYEIYYGLEKRGGHRKNNPRLSPVQVLYFSKGKLVVSTRYKNLDKNEKTIEKPEYSINLEKTNKIKKESKEIINLLKNSKIDDFNDLFNVIKSKKNEIEQLFPLLNHTIKAVNLLTNNSFMKRKLNEYKQINDESFDRERQIILDIAKFILSLKGSKAVDKKNKEVDIDKIVQETLESSMSLIKENKVSGINIVNKLAITEKDAFVKPDILLTNAYIRPGNKYQGGVHGIKGLMIALLETYNKHPDLDRYLTLNVYPRVSMFKYDLHEWDSPDMIKLKKEKLKNEIYKDKELGREVYIDIQPEFLFGFMINPKLFNSSNPNQNKKLADILLTLTNNIYKDAGRYKIDYLETDEQKSKLQRYQTNNENYWDLIDYRIKGKTFNIMKTYHNNELRTNNEYIFKNSFQISGEINDLHDATFMVAFSDNDINEKLSKIKEEIKKGNKLQYANKSDNEIIRDIVNNKLDEISKGLSFSKSIKKEEIFVHKRLYNLIKTSL